MKILLIGSGGREHALAWALSRSSHCARLFVAPGNGGTATLPNAENVALDIADFGALQRFAAQNDVGLTVVGPEQPLADGIVDHFAAAGLLIFGPTRAAAQLEASKAFAKQFMAEQGIPTAQARSFRAHDEALAHVRSLTQPPVIKVSGLAAGKGVFVPETMAEAEQALADIFDEGRFGTVDQVVVEERLHGPELSLLAFCDGHDYALMPAAQDHKRLLDGDRGPNTGGMGAFAPSPQATPALLADLERTVLRPTLDGMAARGTPFVGVLFVGLMLTEAGPKVLEYNVRFGDPETQVIVPLLASDLVEVMVACIEGRLAEQTLSWHEQAAATVIMASGGYPDGYTKGYPISGIDAANALPDLRVFHAGTAMRGNETVTAGGRVLAVTAVNATLDAALHAAYDGVALIDFQDAVYRRDIGG
ncbi:MAG: phosphoribosylamine--glycine ligase [Anaerolineales bacterium]|nr:phosphoribosylamine--glycine ligase [Anaerolineales bacterium]MCB9128529.1 phosphoribosylamine--glycine ligase [Ardenticatenales bacterium]